MPYNRISILNFPKISLEAPPLAAALLCEICDQHGTQYDFIDCNLEFWQALSGDVRHEILDMYAENFVTELSTPARTWLDRYFCDLARRCAGSDLLAISVFSYHSLILTHEFLQKYRDKLNAHVVVGGAGIAFLADFFSDYHIGEKFYRYLHRKNLIDFWVLGEGEQAFADLLSGNVTSDKINNVPFNQMDTFDLVPVPNFDKFDLEAYKFHGKRMIGVEGSRGCVKKCTFCDIHNTWGRYKFKDGVKLAKEILHLRERYHIDHFWFNDSLINGSLKSFRDFIHHLSLCNNGSFTWSSQAIVRTRSQRDEEDFALLKKSGCETLAVGIESFSQSVRWHIGKKFTDDDFDHFLNLAQKYNIKIFILLIIGYPTETQTDFEHALSQLERYQHLADDGTISGIRIGQTMAITPGTPLYDMRKTLGIRESGDVDKAAISWRLGENTLQKRVEWRVTMEDYARKLGYHCADHEMNVEQTMLKFLQIATQ